MLCTYYFIAINEQAYLYPNVADRAGYAYPEDGLLQIFDESEIRQPTQRNARGTRNQERFDHGHDFRLGRRSQIPHPPLRLLLYRHHLPRDHHCALRRAWRLLRRRRLRLHQGRIVALLTRRWLDQQDRRHLRDSMV